MLDREHEVEIAEAMARGCTEEEARLALKARPWRAWCEWVLMEQAKKVKP